MKDPLKFRIEDDGRMFVGDIEVIPASEAITEAGYMAFRQAALELQAAIRDGLYWIDETDSPVMAHSQMRKCADKWYPILDDLTSKEA